MQASRCLGGSFFTFSEKVMLQKVRSNALADPGGGAFRAIPPRHKVPCLPPPKRQNKLKNNKIKN